MTEQVIKEYREKMQRAGIDYISGKITYEEYILKMNELTDEANEKYQCISSNQTENQK